MEVDYPYVQNTGRLQQLFQAIGSAARPERFTTDVIERLGFTSSNDRAFLPMLKKLGFLTDAGVPVSPQYDLLRDTQHRARVLAERIRETYRELFAINTSINAASEPDIRGCISRVTGKDEDAVARLAKTFIALCAQADFSAPAAQVGSGPTHVSDPLGDAPNMESGPRVQIPQRTVAEAPKLGFQYNIQVVLPTTTDIGVYNAIFKSIKENLGI